MNKEQLKEAAKKEVEKVWKPEGEFQQMLINLFIAGYSLKEGAGTVSEWQLCPKCNGQGSVSKPPWLAGDVDQWTSSETQYDCDVCNGAKVLVKPIISESSPTNQDNYWQIRCEAAEKYINESPCDPDIRVDQYKAYVKWEEIKALTGTTGTESNTVVDSGG